MKKHFEEAEVELINLETDVITTSVSEDVRESNETKEHEFNF
jgi:hypothetical protein